MFEDCSFKAKPPLCLFFFFAVSSCLSRLFFQQSRSEGVRRMENFHLILLPLLTLLNLDKSI